VAPRFPLCSLAACRAIARVRSTVVRMYRPQIKILFRWYRLALRPWRGISITRAKGTHNAGAQQEYRRAEFFALSRRPAWHVPLSLFLFHSRWGCSRQHRRRFPHVHLTSTPLIHPFSNTLSHPLCRSCSISRF